MEEILQGRAVRRKEESEVTDMTNDSYKELLGRNDDSRGLHMENEERLGVDLSLNAC